MSVKTHKFGLALFLLFIFFSCAYAGGVDSSGADTQWLIVALVSAMLGALQALCLFVLISMRDDNKQAHEQLWKRLDEHGHAIFCEQGGCKPKTVQL